MLASDGDAVDYWEARTYYLFKIPSRLFFFVRNPPLVLHEQVSFAFSTDRLTLYQFIW